MTLIFGRCRGRSRSFKYFSRDGLSEWITMDNGRDKWCTTLVPLHSNFSDDMLNYNSGMTLTLPSLAVEELGKTPNSVLFQAKQ